MALTDATAWPQAKKAKKEAKKEVTADSDDEAAEPVSGAMDSFLGGDVKMKKTKKKLTEKTFIDDKGYMGTLA